MDKSDGETVFRRRWSISCSEPISFTLATVVDESNEKVCCRIFSQNNTVTLILRRSSAASAGSLRLLSFLRRLRSAIISLTRYKNRKTVGVMKLTLELSILPRFSCHGLRDKFGHNCLPFVWSAPPGDYVVLRLSPSGRDKTTIMHHASVGGVWMA